MKSVRFRLLLSVFGCTGLIAGTCAAQNAKPSERTSELGQRKSGLGQNDDVQPSGKKFGAPKLTFTQSKPGGIQNRGTRPANESRFGAVHPAIPATSHTLTQKETERSPIYGMPHVTRQSSPLTVPHLGVSAPGIGHKNGPPVIGGPTSSPRTLTGLNGTTLKRRP
jgi:hypothetical protein